MIPVKKSVHYRVLELGDYEYYQQYLIAVNDTITHSKTKFKSLLDNFDLKQMVPIEANMYEHSIGLWIQDGNHRISVLLHKQIFGTERIPMRYINVNIYEPMQNMLKEALRKTVGYSQYNGWNNRLEFGYHSFDIYNFHVQGQRNPVKRLEKIKPFYDFTGKKVLDLGCNTGGMLFHSSEIQKGVGVDYDQNCINSCNLFKERLCLGCDLEFYKEDLNGFNYNTFCNKNQFQPDIVFLLSIGSWVKEWKRLYTDVYVSGATILLETNNDVEGAPQLQLFRDLQATIQLVSDKSDDDCTGNLQRKTYLISRNVVAKKRIAICYWGMTRSLRHVYKTHEEKLFSVLRAAGYDIDIYIHSWKTEKNLIWQHSSPVPIDYEEYKLLNPTKYKLDEQSTFLDSIAFSDYFYEDLWKKHGNDRIFGEWIPELVRNHLCALESQKRVTQMMMSSGNPYEYVLYMRPDVEVHNNFPVECLTKLQPMDCCIPNYQHYVGYNDKFAAMRYEDCKEYSHRIDEIIDYRKNIGNIRAERYVHYILTKYYKNIHQIDFKFTIVRPDGTLVK